jgi:hypothetical protein
MAGTRIAKVSSASLDDLTEPQGPLACADALGRTAAETCRQHERLARLMTLRVQQDELEAAHALVDTCDLALAESVAAFEKKCGKSTVSADAEERQKASTLWLAAREYLRRHSIAEKASRQLTQHSPEKLGDLQLEYELEASALEGLKSGEPVAVEGAYNLPEGAEVQMAPAKSGAREHT